MRDACICSAEETANQTPPSLHLRGWAALLEWFYARAGLDLLRLEQLKGHEVPAPYRTLLVHSSDMTPTLEGFFGESLGLTVLSRELQCDCYLREVVVRLGLRRQRVLYGVIRIFLNHLPPNARKRVLEEGSRSAIFWKPKPSRI